MFTRWLGRTCARIYGWDISCEFPPIQKCIIAVAPHTSMMDFLIGKFYFWSKGVRIRFIIKKELFWFPLGPILKAAGAIPVQRGAKNNMVDSLVEYLDNKESAYVLFTPEGTRKKARKWKKGFLVVAYKAKLPVLFGYVDYKKKEVGTLNFFYPTGNPDADLKEIQQLYKGFHARYPDQFSTGDD